MNRQELADEIEKQIEEAAQMGEPPSFALERHDADMLVQILRTGSHGFSTYVNREAIIRQCIERVKAEHLEDPTELADDIAYDHAVNDCAEALESLLNEPVCESSEASK